MSNLFDRGKQFNFEDIHRSLASISVFSNRRSENLQPLLIYEMTCTGESSYKSMTLRELLHYVNQYAEDVDDSYYLNMEEKQPQDYEEKLWQSIEAVNEATSVSQKLQRIDDNLLLPAPDEDGSYTAVKTLRFRDLRRLDIHTTSLNDTAILVRKHVVVFAMDPICAVITSEKVMLVVPDGADSLIGILHQYLKEWVEDQEKATRAESVTESNVGLRHRFQKKPRRMNVDFLLTAKIPFELHAYEALLMTVKELESQQVKYLTNLVDSLLITYRSGTILPLHIQSNMRQAKNDLSMIRNRLLGCLQALRHLLEDDEEMALMNLSLLKKKPSLYKFPLHKEILSKHDDIEELVEFYISDLRAIATKIETTENQIRNAVELVSVRLDTAQNQLLFANTTLLILSSAVTFGNYIAGIFGMNLDQTIYLLPKHGSFASAFSVSGGVILILFTLIFGYLKWAGVLPSLFPT